jgi:hypothetical protein
VAEIDQRSQRRRKRSSRSKKRSKHKFAKNKAVQTNKKGNELPDDVFIYTYTVYKTVD